MTQDVETSAPRPRQPPPSWASIPNKKQLAIVWSVRVADFFQQAALQAYMYYQLKSLSPNASESDISFQSGVLLGVFTAAQIFTGLYWGRLADSPSWGRKNVILVSLIGQGVSCVGLGFSKTFVAAAIWRCLGGAVNATVGGARTVLAESTEKKYHSRTFLLLPLSWNVANVIGPILGGFLTEPVARYPRLLGENTLLGQSIFVGWMRHYPYAPPNLLCAAVLFLDAILVFVGLKETLAARKYHRDRGLELAEGIRHSINQIILRRGGYSSLTQQDTTGMSEGILSEDVPVSQSFRKHRSSHSIVQSLIQKELPVRLAAHIELSEKSSLAPSIFRIFTPNVLVVLSTVAFFDFQLGGFTSLWSIFLSSNPATWQDMKAMNLPFHFSGGLGFTPATVGLAMSVLGAVGIVLQLALYPHVNGRFGLLRTFRYSLMLFPITYSVAPYLSLLTGTSTALWTGIVAVAFLQILARTFSQPASVLLINNSAPSPEMLGTLHGLGAATSSAFRTIGPIVAGHWYANGIQTRMVGYAWWSLAVVSAVGIIPSFWTKDGK